MSKLTISAEEARDIVWGDTYDFETIERKIVDTSRWSIQYSGIFKSIKTGKFYKVYWSEGATEQQDESPFEYEDEVVFQEVVPQEVMVVKYVGV